MVRLVNQILEDITYIIIYSAMINTLQNILPIKDGQAVRASGTETVNLGSIPRRIKRETLTASIYISSAVT